MPYVSHQRRLELLDLTEEMEQYIDEAVTVGDMNYLVTKLMVMYLEAKGDSYTTINDVIGILECAKLEFYRREAIPYEEQKIRQNGDVF